MLISTLNRQGKQVLIIQLGSGLIGSAIARSISDRAVLRDTHKVNWADISVTVSWLQALDLSTDQLHSAEVIWAAGKAGFGATPAETKVER